MNFLIKIKCFFSIERNCKLCFDWTVFFKSFKTESIRKLSNSNFQWTKTLYQNNLNNIAFFFTFFKGYI